MLRLVAMLATAAMLALVVLDSDAPAVMLTGFLPIAWIVLEACWHLLGPKP